jgi:hypothetical protein
LAFLSFAVACSGGDAPGPDSGGATCSTAADCDDDVFCNGSERCAPGDTEADARGCAPASAPPCALTQTCDEPSATCITECVVETDADGDGRDAISCGGDDCDDSDARRAPGLPEICDDDERDEDCDPATFGDRDSDRDGFTDAACCNGTGADRLCGDDCDDALPSVHPTEAETCDRLDNDCDGLTDETVLHTFYRDVDGDGHGVATDTVPDCSAPPGYAVVGNDCNDMLRAINPGAAEACDGTVDEDCDEAVDEACPCTPEGTSRSCGPMAVGICRPGTQICTSSGWADCAGALEARPEVCEATLDEDCDASVDEGCDCTNGTLRSCGDDRGECRSVSQTCMSGAWPRPCADEPGVVGPSTERCDGARDEDCDGAVDEGCSCTDGATRPCGTGACAGMQVCASGAWMACDGAAPGPEICNTVDEDCDGVDDASDADVVGLGAACGTTVGVCEPGIQSCAAGALQCGGPGYMGPLTETCNHLDDDCDGDLDDGVGVASCSTARDVSGPVFPKGAMWCFPTLPAGRACMPYWTALEGYDLTLGPEPAVAYLGVGLTDRMDWGEQQTVTAVFRARRTAAGPRGSFGVLVSPIREAGGDARRGLPVPAAGDRGMALLVEFVPAGAPALTLVQFTPTATADLSSRGLFPSCALSDTDTDYTLALTNMGPSFTATLTSTAGCSETLSAYVHSAWQSQIYVVDPAFTLYDVGAVADDDGSLRAVLRSLTIDRPNTGATRAHCVACPP